jgi:hypothetical protein
MTYTIVNKYLQNQIDASKFTNIQQIKHILYGSVSQCKEDRILSQASRNHHKFNGV